MPHFSDQYKLFIEEARKPDTMVYCGSGSARFVIHPTGKITRCFGRTDSIGSIYEQSVDFIHHYRMESECREINCFDPCDFDCAEKWTSSPRGEHHFPIHTPWLGNLVSEPGVTSSRIEHSAKNSVSLDFIQINLTPLLLCNYKCNYCIAGSDKVDPKIAKKQQLDPGVTLTFLSKVLEVIRPKYGMLLYVSGGEPLLWTGITELAHYVASTQQIAMKLNTNGSLSSRLMDLADAFCCKQGHERLYIQLSAHIDEPRFSEEQLLENCSALSHRLVQHRVSLVGDKDGSISTKQQALLKSLKGVAPVKIYSDYRHQGEFEFHQVFLDALRKTSGQS